MQRSDLYNLNKWSLYLLSKVRCHRREPVGGPLGLQQSLDCINLTARKPSTVSANQTARRLFAQKRTEYYAIQYIHYKQQVLIKK